jgi:hypothetical protein
MQALCMDYLTLERVDPNSITRNYAWDLVYYKIIFFKPSTTKKKI